MYNILYVLTVTELRNLHTLSSGAPDIIWYDKLIQSAVLPGVSDEVRSSWQASRAWHAGGEGAPGSSEGTAVEEWAVAG